MISTSQPFSFDGISSQLGTYQISEYIDTAGTSLFRLQAAELQEMNKPCLPTDLFYLLFRPHKIFITLMLRFCTHCCDKLSLSVLSTIVNWKYIDTFYDRVVNFLSKTRAQNVLKGRLSLNKIQRKHIKLQHCIAPLTLDCLHHIFWLIFATFQSYINSIINFLAPQHRPGQLALCR